MTGIDDVNNSRIKNRNFSSKGHSYKKEKLEMRRHKLKQLLHKEKEIYDTEMISKKSKREKNRIVPVEDHGGEKNKKHDDFENNDKKININQIEEEIPPNHENKNRISSQSSNRPSSQNKEKLEFYNHEPPKFSLNTQIPRLEEELDNHLSKYTQNLEKLKYEDFLTRKKMQDDLLSNINNQMDKLKYGLNDKSYEEKAAQEWIREYTEKINNYDNNSYMNFSYLNQGNPAPISYFNKNNSMPMKSPLIINQGSQSPNMIHNYNNQYFPVQQIHPSHTSLSKNYNKYYN
jgi:hypothetical protein